MARKRNFIKIGDIAWKKVQDWRLFCKGRFFLSQHRNRRNKKCLIIFNHKIKNMYLKKNDEHIKHK